MLDRIIKNWKTTMAAIVPAAVALLWIFGIEVSPQMQVKILTVLAGVYAVILLFSKDTPKE